MTTPVTPATTVDTSLRTGSARRFDLRRALLLALGMFVLLSLVRVITGAQDITSAGALGATVNLAVPIGLAGLGGLWSERSGVVNIGLEGMMILGTWFGAEFAFATGSPWMGVVGGIVGGVLGGAIHAFATIVIGVDQIVSGVAINILALGLGRYLAGVFFTGKTGGGPTQSPQVPTFNTLKFPGADAFFKNLQGHHWFFVSDIGGLIGGILTSLDVFTIIAILTIPATWFLLWRTAFGLRLRACGENPTAAESLGVNVYLMKWIAVLTSGGLAGLAGAFLVDFNGIYREGQTGGRGYIGLAAMIFGNWRPGGLTGGAALFGYVDALQLRAQPGSVRSLLLVAVLVLIPSALWVAWRSRSWKRGVGLFVVGVVVFIVFRLLKTIPQEFTSAAPYVVTLLVLALASQRLRPPKADGVPWRKGQRE